MNLNGGQRQQHLPRAAKSLEAGKDQADDLLYAQVGIALEAGVPTPELADRDADAQLAAPGFGPGGLEHPRGEHRVRTR